MASRLNLPLSIASVSIGLPRHTLHQKVEAAVTAGFSGMELGFPDLVSYATITLGKDVKEDDYTSLCEAGTHVRSLFERHNLRIVLLQPFSNFEGWPRGSKEREAAFARARGWIDIMSVVGTDTLQVGSSDSPGITTSLPEIAADIAELADLLAERGFRLAYENWCWSTHAPTWKDVWTIVNTVDRPNVGLCLDTFQTSGGEWGDPTTKSSVLETGGMTIDQVNMSYDRSLSELARTVPQEKIFFLQISDAYRADPPLDPDVDESGLRPRGRWSHSYRPLPYDGGYLPIAKCLEAVMATGFRGWLSVEVFDGSFEEKYGYDLLAFVKKAKNAVDRLLEEVDLRRVTTGYES
ncbi:hypothetical protein MRS44_016701 [Fusarium solani]|jgi:sugar phosphate isomerase/epimerase|uniref:Xylose isomerase-like TIM barrel n=1 Tax=Fusarium solani TaxID=169388 RepID=A0A9P9HDG5_FUSSL|nr:xylose isomerase-like TIM barrel [Fusarium solani]KAH7254632.1 xylose isomerase-like TIM barrel [Fusarium solani]KAJ3456678.1 hypothetical protein MRS44_016701 [Fusarium solani]